MGVYVFVGTFVFTNFICKKKSCKYVVRWYPKFNVLRVIPHVIFVWFFLLFVKKYDNTFIRPYDCLRCEEKQGTSTVDEKFSLVNCNILYFFCFFIFPPMPFRSITVFNISSSSVYVYIKLLHVTYWGILCLKVGYHNFAK